MVSTQDIRAALDIALDEIDHPDCCSQDDMISFKKRFDSLFTKLEAETNNDEVTNEETELEDSSTESEVEVAPNSSDDEDLVYDPSLDDKER